MRSELEKAARPRALPLPILALAVAAFAIGTTEFVIMGLLPSLARDLGVGELPLPAAGLALLAFGVLAWDTLSTRPRAAAGSRAAPSP